MGEDREVQSHWTRVQNACKLTIVVELADYVIIYFYLNISEQTASELW